MFDDFEPIAFGYGAVGLVVGMVMAKYGMAGMHIKFIMLWKVLTVIVCAIGAFILGMIQSGD
jgi:hypothetical protein